jgi:phospholipase C
VEDPVTSRLLVVSLAVALLSSLGLAATPPQTPTKNLRPGISSIQHVIILVQENRSTDNLFHGLKGTDSVNYGLNSKGQKITLEPIHLVSRYDLDHSHKAFVNEYDGGKMDGADLVYVTCKTGAKNCINPQFKYVMESDIAPYFEMAEEYAFADRMFQSNEGGSYPAHQFVIAATSAPNPSSLLYVAEIPAGVPNAPQNTGCTAPAEEFVQMIDPLGFEDLVTYPCFEHQTLMDLLDHASLTWRYYTPLPNQIWTAPNSIKHIRNGNDWNYVIDSPSQVLTDISQGNLANVAWVMPPVLSSDHPNENNGTGPSWISSVVDAVGQSSYWSSSAIFITWDDWGGWYDHVAPNIRNSYEYGLRVGLIVVSPYAKTGYVSHVTHDFSSIIKFTEEAFGLPSLGFGDEYSDDLTDCFNFNQQARPFHKFKSKLDANYFINDRSPQPESDEY